eukprot:6467382-Amphidinium_carterae.1
MLSEAFAAVRNPRCEATLAICPQVVGQCSERQRWQDAANELTQGLLAKARSSLPDKSRVSHLRGEELHQTFLMMSRDRLASTDGGGGASVRQASRSEAAGVLH